MRISTRLPLAVAALAAGLGLAIYQVRDFRRVAAPFQMLTARRVPAAGGEVGELLGRRGIERMDLSGDRVNDETLLALKPNLEQLPWLNRLSLAGSRISGPGLAALSKLGQLHAVELQHTPVDDAAISYLTKLRQLESLNLAGTAVGDRGVSRLAALAQLRVLWLDGTRISDRCIKDLIRFKRLEIISIANTQMSEAGARRLEESLSGCVVIR